MAARPADTRGYFRGSRHGPSLATFLSRCRPNSVRVRSSRLRAHVYVQCSYCPLCNVHSDPGGWMCSYTWGLIDGIVFIIFVWLEGVATLTEIGKCGGAGTSHSWQDGGDYKPGRSQKPGCLGADFEWSGERGGYVVTNIVRGDVWDRHRGGPLARAGANVQVCARLLHGLCSRPAFVRSVACPSRSTADRCCPWPVDWHFPVCLPDQYANMQCAWIACMNEWSTFVCVAVWLAQQTDPTPRAITGGRCAHCRGPASVVSPPLAPAVSHTVRRP